ncbi:hypothetical protein BWK59_00655 [Flavobacterium davisii]|uniref:Uncharacterized protein n=1 Tax=Flavobacterium davisii TaxID=2906077 RepID=A0A246GLH9_9FLAO|nr:hypothetical protein [Flavobacterium davisii]OWP85282.1 hypothetical protein BWK59_00655 [Flavobacterium davisii]
MRKGLKIFVGVVAFFVMLSFFFGGGIEKEAERQMNEIENTVALDAEKQYEIAKKSGTSMDAYVQAGMVCAAYLQANDEVNYKKWKAIEKEEAKNAGIPIQ